MKTYVVLFRGINVGGNHMLPMKELKVVLEQNGCQSVQTYIQSGNVILNSSLSDVQLAKRLSAAVSKSHGFEPRVMILTRTELERAAAANPFPSAGENPKSVHVFFLDGVPKKPDLKSLEALRIKGEEFALKGKVFYLHTPDGFGPSKLLTRIEKHLGVQGTARNWRTVTTLVGMVRALSD